MTKKRTIFLSVLIGLLIVTLMSFSLTKARYSKEADSTGDYLGEIDYVISNQVEVRTPEELLGAIENGYTNIQISDEVDNPIIITGGVSDINSDLTIDLNGHELQRNNREPMLNVTNGVRLTIIDSSDEQTGCFYNPVGSVLRISGGTLTVAAGIFESGPRNGISLSRNTGEAVYADEYAENTNGAWQTAAGARMGGEYAVTYYEKSADSASYGDGTAKTMPVIVPHVTQHEENRTVNGNMYFSAAYSGDVSADTYLYFTIDDENTAATRIAADNGSADFYYTYKMTYANGGYTYAGPGDAAEGALVTVYGYKNVKGSAGSAAARNNEYASIQMQQGNFYVRGGSYTSYFGETSTYCVSAEGGYMAVESGTFEALGSGICVGNSYEEISDEEFLRIASGRFYSQFGDTVHVAGGRLNVTGGAFYKYAEGSSYAAEAHANGSAINISGGELNIDGSQSRVDFTLEGSYLDGIYSQGGALKVSGISLAVTAAQGVKGVYGVHAAGGTVELSNSDIHVGNASASAGTQTDNFGVYSTEGVTLNMYGECDVAVRGDYSSCVYANGGSVNYSAGGGAGLTVTMDMAAGGTGAPARTSTAVSAVNGSITFRGDATVSSDGLGITTSPMTTGGAGTGGEQADFTYSGGTLEVTSSGGTAMYITGKATLSGTVNITCTIGGEGYTFSGGSVYDGVYVGGTLDAGNAVFNVTHTGIAYAANANGTIASSDYGENGEIKYETYQTFVTRSVAVRVANGNVTIEEGKILSLLGGGISVNSGTVFLGVDRGDNADLTVEVTADEGNAAGNGVVFDGWYESGVVDNWNYKLNKTGGPAIAVNGGSLTVYSGTYTSRQGDGILVRNLQGSGTVTINNGIFSGNDEYDPYPGETNFAGPGASYAFRMLGGTATVNGGTFGEGSTCSGVFVMGTSSNENDGKLIVNKGGFNVGGQAGISVYRYAKVTLGTEGGNNGDVTFSGQAAGLVLEGNYSAGGYNGTGATASVTVNSGTYKSTSTTLNNSDGIWYNEDAAQLAIHGGSFSGARRSGLYFAVDCGDSVKISGGTFTGHSLREYGYNFIISLYPYYLEGAIAAACERNAGGSWSGVGSEISVNDIIASGHSAVCSGGYTSDNTYASGSDACLGESLAGADTVVVN